MDIINIVNDSEQKFLIENILILNQQKLLDSIIYLFNTEFNVEELTINHVKEYLDTKYFINWSLFIRLINLKSVFMYKGKRNNSIFYFVELKCIKILKFLFSLENKIINFDFTNFNYNILHKIFFNLYKEDDLIELIFENNEIKHLYLLKDKFNFTPLCYILQNCSENIILKAIKKNILSIDYKDKNYNRPIHWACKNEYINLIIFLINTNTNIDLEVKNIYYYKPIHYACEKGNLEIIKLLVELNIDLESKTLLGLKPIDIAIKKCDKEAIIFLIEKNVIMDQKKFCNIIGTKNLDLINYILDNYFNDFNSETKIYLYRILLQKKIMYFLFNTVTNTISNILSIIDNSFSRSYDGHIYFYDDEEEEEEEEEEDEEEEDENEDENENKNEDINDDTNNNIDDDQEKKNK